MTFDIWFCIFFAERKSVGEKFDSLSQEIKHLQKGFSELRAELTKMQVNDENVAGFA